MTPRLALLAIFGAMVIYGLNFGVTRWGTQHGLTPSDLVALRFMVAGPLLLPHFIRQGALTCAGIGWKRGLVLGITSGAPMTLFMNTGLAYAPAAHGAALGPGTVTLMGVVYGIVAAGIGLSSWTIAGLVGIVAGLAAIAVAGSVAGASNVLFGDLCFFASGLLWSVYPIVIYRWRVGPTTSAAIVAVLSLAYLPVYALWLSPRILDVPVWLVVGQAVFQGGFNIVIGLWLWGHAVRVLGPAKTQLFPPLIPVLGTLFAIPILGEIPGPAQALGLALIVGGIVLALRGQRVAAARG